MLIREWLAIRPWDRERYLRAIPYIEERNLHPMAVCGNEYRGPGYPQVHGKVFCNKPDNHVFGLTWLERQHWNLGDMAAPKRLAWWDGDQKAEQDRIHGHKDW